jgi:hypothetical protein
MTRDGERDDRPTRLGRSKRTGRRLLLMLATTIAAAATTFALLSHGGPGPAHVSEARASKTQVASLLSADMTLSSEARPHGVPTSNDWANHPRVGETTNLSAFTAFTAWGQLYRCATSGGTPPVEFQDLQAWARYPGRGWVRLQQSSELAGNAFAETYAANRSVPALVREATSARTVVGLKSGYNFHFWPKTGRVVLPGTQQPMAWVIALRARYSAPPSASACAVLSVGGDLWRSQYAPFAGTGRNNVDVGIGRFKRVGMRWRAFTMTTAPAVVKADPPPLDLPADELR